MMFQNTGEFGPSKTGEDYDRYVGRRLSLEKPKIAELELNAIQEDVRKWAEATGILSLEANYLAYDRKTIDQKIGSLIDYLRQNHPQSASAGELDITDDFIKCAFEMYYSEEGVRDGSFAFVAPARVSRLNTEYGEEVEHVIPALRYVPNDLRAHFMVGLPPFVIDTYGRDASGRRGYVVFCPTYMDMLTDIPPEKLAESVTKVINDTIDFCQAKLGVKVAGLAAILPRLTGYGKTITNKEIAITTGHGGTTYLIEETMKRAAREGLISENSLGRIGIIGLGSIGLSIAEILADKFPNSDFLVHDTRQERIELAVSSGRSNILGATSIGQLLRESGIAISAVTTPISVSNELGNSSQLDCLVLDDSQPGSFNPDEVRDFGSLLAWPIATSEIPEAQRTGYDYATLVHKRKDLFGCEAEAASLALVAQDLRNGGKSEKEIMTKMHELGIRKAVDAKQVDETGQRLREYGFGAAELQAFGKRIS